MLRGSFASCEGKRTGEYCQAACPSGSSAERFRLTCDTRGLYNIPPQARCRGNVCRVPYNVDPGALYTPCNGKLTGHTCRPTCRRSGHQATCIELHCDAAGRYDARGATCNENVCIAIGESYPGYVWPNRACTTVSECRVGAIRCAAGYVPATEGERYIQLECPQPGGHFIPSGCSRAVDWELEEGSSVGWLAALLGVALLLALCALAWCAKRARKGPQDRRDPLPDALGDDGGQVQQYDTFEDDLDKWYA